MITKLTMATLLVRLWIVAEDDGQWNHLLKVVDNERTDMLISYTGNSPLGNEGDSLRLTITGECTRVLRPGEYKGGRPHPTGAFICTADEVSK